MAAASRRLWTPSLASRLVTCTLAVLLLMNSCSAIWRLERPSTAGPSPPVPWRCDVGRVGAGGGRGPRATPGPSAPAACGRPRPEAGRRGARARSVPYGAAAPGRCRPGRRRPHDRDAGAGRVAESRFSSYRRIGEPPSRRLRWTVLAVAARAMPGWAAWSGRPRPAARRSGWSGRPGRAGGC